MKPKFVLLAIVLLALYLVGQKLAWDSQRYDYVNNYMNRYTSAKMRKVLTAGHDALLADLAMIRGIQFYGMNYPLFDKKPTMYNQFKSLADATIDMDPRHFEAYRFWGFAMTSAQRGKVDAYRFLMAGAHRMAATDEVFTIIQPNMWEVAKDAAYVAEYELQKATKEWGCDAYTFAEKARDCPEFLHRLKVLACRDVDPDPIPALQELATRANQSGNVAIWQLNLDHMRRIISEEHKRFWDAASQAYYEIHGASPTRIEQLTKNVGILKKAVQEYQKVSSEWAEGGVGQLYPNMVNPLPEKKGKLEFRIAQIPELPEDPYGGEYLILDLQGKPSLVGTGINELERESFLEPINQTLKEYQKDHNGECPEDLDAFSQEYNLRLPVADGFGYPLLLDYGKCEFYFPPVSEENPPPLPPYGEEKKTADEEIDLTLMEDDSADSSPASATDEVKAGTADSDG
ncbi:MAG: hypothetical protein KC931_03250 [Candidatus Omnitrophica bacterium]|nr:hypothetical protein [Candidatus Omnitrophota bacterium]MCA9416287.1 hypothetical protein [Candidatus Omnitrophota bacterium]MCA9424680.1 hypothetical protein [Candidatus Omnitrophota bacterium]MCA9431806.1 hypothetical protein [Candidatus Omnitrophota bacterium]MCA9444098.1 hypothetical protein [Candidatus Omnitrophota bacterium]